MSCLLLCFICPMSLGILLTREVIPLRIEVIYLEDVSVPKRTEEEASPHKCSIAPLSQHLC